MASKDISHIWNRQFFSVICNFELVNIGHKDPLFLEALCGQGCPSHIFVGSFLSLATKRNQNNGTTFVPLPSRELTYPVLKALLSRSFSTFPEVVGYVIVPRRVSTFEWRCWSTKGIEPSERRQRVSFSLFSWRSKGCLFLYQRVRYCIFGWSWISGHNIYVYIYIYMRIKPGKSVNFGWNSYLQLQRVFRMIRHTTIVSKNSWNLRKMNLPETLRPQRVRPKTKTHKSTGFLSKSTSSIWRFWERVSYIWGDTLKQSLK